MAKDAEMRGRAPRRGGQAGLSVAARALGRRGTLGLCAGIALTLACGGSPAVTPSPTAAPPEPASAPQPTAGDEPVLVPGGFEFERVRLMDPSELPDGVPVPVPYGGVIDESMGAFEGELLAVEYDPRFFQTAVAFYATWIDMQGLDASELMSFSSSATGWEVSIDGQPVRIEISLSPDGSATQLAIYWD